MECRVAAVADEFLDLLVRDLQRSARVTACQSTSVCMCAIEETRFGGGVFGTYSLGIRIAHLEKFLRVSGACLGFEDVLDAVCVANTQRKSHAAYENVHIVFGGEETAAGKRQDYE
jgi:hypothetical protein